MCNYKFKHTDKISKFHRKRVHGYVDKPRNELIEREHLCGNDHGLVSNIERIGFLWPINVIITVALNHIDIN